MTAASRSSASAMTLTFELAHFVVRDGAEEALLAERPAMIRALHEAFPDVLAAWLTREDDGSWVDVVLWRSREAAEEAARDVNQVPEARQWFRHIAESRGLRHVDVAHGDMFELGDSCIRARQELA